jgi:hypothetical protein
MAQDVALAKSSERHKINFIFNPAFGWSKLSPINFSFSATDTQQPFPAHTDSLSSITWRM